MCVCDNSNLRNQGRRHHFESGAEKNAASGARRNFFVCTLSCDNLGVISVGHGHPKDTPLAQMSRSRLHCALYPISATAIHNSISFSAISRYVIALSDLDLLVLLVAQTDCSYVT